MQLEYAEFHIPIDDNQREALDQKAREGWQPVPGETPYAVWKMCRPVQQPASEGIGFGTLHIDESKIFILRDGKLIDAAGNVVPSESVS
jgi:hypothetical protein